MLSIVLVIVIYVLRIVFDMQVKILKNHYKIQGQIEILTSIIAPLESSLDSNIFSFVMPQAMSETSEHSEKTDTTTVEVDMDSKVTSPVKEVDQTKPDNDELLSAQS
jgi:hypothetical protein